ncbi:MAG TPA: hypothetical protein VNL34_03825 [Candidatus Nitrosotenuis sp.]|nr:hypothetical protein [Candidatus Nitrosotenuis sp.]
MFVTMISTLVPGGPDNGLMVISGIPKPILYESNSDCAKDGLIWFTNKAVTTAKTILAKEQDLK